MFLIKTLLTRVNGHRALGNDGVAVRGGECGWERVASLSDSSSELVIARYKKLWT